MIYDPVGKKLFSKGWVIQGGGPILPLPGDKWEAMKICVLEPNSKWNMFPPFPDSNFQTSPSLLIDVTLTTGFQIIHNFLHQLLVKRFPSLDDAHSKTVINFLKLCKRYEGESKFTEFVHYKCRPYPFSGMENNNQSECSKPFIFSKETFSTVFPLDLTWVSQDQSANRLIKIRLYLGQILQENAKPMKTVVFIKYATLIYG